MVDMIASFRAFEAGQKVIPTIDATLRKAATQVGSMSSGPGGAPPPVQAHRPGLKFHDERTI